jgi:hypothetical protein
MGVDEHQEDTVKLAMVKDFSNEPTSYNVIRRLIIFQHHSLT